ncbi:uncharacterized protein [Periplaneta americana]|uniref:uncharacterized protein n=1 Tax=Periplaneta americana TaxID=6978 RepID=UPI0037E842D5
MEWDPSAKGSVYGLGQTPAYDHSTNCPAERSFYALKRLKDYHRTTVTEEKLSNLAVLRIENDITRTLDYEDVINIFTERGARRRTFCLKTIYQLASPSNKDDLFQIVSEINTKLKKGKKSKLVNDTSMKKRTIQIYEDFEELNEDTSHSSSYVLPDFTNKLFKTHSPPLKTINYVNISEEEKTTVYNENTLLKKRREPETLTKKREKILNTTPNKSESLEQGTDRLEMSTHTYHARMDTKLRKQPNQKLCEDSEKINENYANSRNKSFPSRRIFKEIQNLPSNTEHYGKPSNLDGFELDDYKRKNYQLGKSKKNCRITDKEENLMLSVEKKRKRPKNKNKKSKRKLFWTSMCKTNEDKENEIFDSDQDEDNYNGSLEMHNKNECGKQKQTIRDPLAFDVRLPCSTPKAKKSHNPYNINSELSDYPSCSPKFSDKSLCLETETETDILPQCSPLQYAPVDIYSSSQESSSDNTDRLAYFSPPESSLKKKRMNHIFLEEKNEASSNEDCNTRTVLPPEIDEVPTNKSISSHNVTSAITSTNLGEDQNHDGIDDDDDYVDDSRNEINDKECSTQQSSSALSDVNFLADMFDSTQHAYHHKLRVTPHRNLKLVNCKTLLDM